MRATWVILAALSAALFTTSPVMAADDGSIVVDDACGDMHAYVQYNGTHQELPPTDRTPRFDFDSVGVASTASGVRVTFTSCGPIGDADALGGERAFSTALPGKDYCALGLDEPEYGAPAQARHVQLTKTCYRDDTGPTAGTPLQDNTDERFAITLPESAVKVAGNTMTVDLDRAGLTGEAAQALAVGTTWRGANFATIETLTAWGGGFGTDPLGTWNYSGPGGIDWAGSSDSTFTIR